MYKEVFAQRLYARRNELDLSQIQVSNETGINQSNISKYEQGKLEPNLETLGILANYYEVSIDWLLGNPHGKKEGDMIYAALTEFYNEAMHILQHTEYQKFKQDDEREIIRKNLRDEYIRILKKYNQFKEEQ